MTTALVSENTAPRRQLTRRAALERLGTGLLGTLALWPGSLSLKARTGEPGAFRFIAVNDLHCMSPGCGPWLEHVVRQMRGEGAEFCLLCGDLTEHAESRHLATVRDVFRPLGVPIHAVPGNHDWVGPTDRGTYDDIFPRHLNYLFEHRGWQFVGLDSTDGQRYEKTTIQAATLQWLDRNLRRLDPRKPTVIFTHFPLGLAVKYQPLNTDDLLGRFRQFNLKGMLSGHWHGYTLRWENEAFAVTNPCCALKRNNHDRSPAKGYLLCEARDGLLTYRFVPCRIPRSLAEASAERPAQRQTR